MLHRRIGALMFGLALIGMTAVAPAQNIIHNLGTLPGGDNSQARAVNASGQVVGYSNLSASTYLHGFIWDSTSGIQDLGHIGGDYTSAYDINAGAQVVGEGYLSAPLGLRHAFVWDSTNGIQDLNLSVPAGTLTLAFGINDSAQIVGIYGGASSYISNAGTTLTDLGALTTPSNGTFVRAVNNAGHAVGFSNITPTGAHRARAFLWTPAKAILNLGTLAGDASSKAIDINNIGQVVGESKSATSILRAFIWDATNGMTDLGQLPGLPYRRALGINNLGEVVGQAFPNVNEESQNMVPFIWDPTNGMRDVNTLLPPGSGWTLRNATDINDDGDIVGYGIIGGNTRAYMLETPTRTTYTLTTAVVGQGTIGLNPPGGTYLEGQQVTVTATASLGWTFSAWQGDTSKDAKATTTITMNADKSVTAVFTELPAGPTYTLTTAVIGQGTVALNPPGGTYPQDQQVTVTATPASNWVFSGWQGDTAKNAKATTTITMNANKSVTAVFIEIPVPPSGGCGGSITSTPNGSSAAPMVLVVAILLGWATFRRLNTAPA